MLIRLETTNGEQYVDAWDVRSISRFLDRDGGEYAQVSTSKDTYYVAGTPESVARAVNEARSLSPHGPYR